MDIPQFCTEPSGKTVDFQGPYIVSHFFAECGQYHGCWCLGPGISRSSGDVTSAICCILVVGFIGYGYHSPMSWLCHPYMTIPTINSLTCGIFLWKHKYIIFYHSQHWNGTGCWNPFSWKIQSHYHGCCRTGDARSQGISSNAHHMPVISKRFSESIPRHFQWFASTIKCVSITL